MTSVPAATTSCTSAPRHELVFPTDLLETDGEPLDSDWHRMAIALLVETIRYYFRQRHDFFAGGNMFIYFSEVQARNRDFRGPDFFFVWGVDGRRDRPYWVVWQEDGRYPNVIIELLSPSTAKEDRTTKKAIYEQVFRTPEYILYDPYERTLEGWHLTNGSYEPMELDNGRIWSRQLELYVGTWDGPFQDVPRTWLRFFDIDGNLILIGREDQQRRADSEKKRADEAEAALARLQARLAELEGKGPQAVVQRDQGRGGN